MAIKSQNKLFIPYITAFVAGFCIMVVELIASRIIARYLGSSIYTWTAVIGVVLGGIAVGNYLGGIIADKFDPKRTLSLLFIGASISCILIAPLSQVMGRTSTLLLLPLSARIILHVAAIFLVPSVIFGMISPVVAKFALNQGLSIGKTIGSVYAWTSAGSITGVFITGFVLISILGTMAILWILCGILALVGLLYGIKTKAPYIWLLIFVFTVFMDIKAPASFQKIGELTGLRKTVNSEIIFETESRHSLIQVTRPDKYPTRRMLVLDNLIHSIMDIEEPTNIYAEYQYPYIKMYGVLTELLKQKMSPDFLVIGGGAYVFPRYLEEKYPKANIDVVEIDPLVSEVARQIFFLPDDTRIKTYNVDARSYVNDLILQGADKKYDFIFSDAISGLSVPYPLTTQEYNDEMRDLLSPGGAYVLTLIDSLDPGKFLGAMMQTLERTFSHTYVYFPDSLYGRGVSFGDTFVIVCSAEPIDLSELALKEPSFTRLNKKQIDLLKDNAGNIILTDDYSPVDNLLAPVFYSRGRRLASVQFTNMGDQEAKNNDLEKAARYYTIALRADDDFAQAYNNFGNTLFRQGLINAAIERYQTAIRLWPRFAEAYSNLGTLYIKEGNMQEGINYLNAALDVDPDSAELNYNLGAVFANMGIEGEAVGLYKKAIESKPDFAEAHIGLGNIYWGQHKLNMAVGHYAKALESKPDPQAHNNIGAILAKQGKLEDAVFHWREALKLDPNYENARKNLDSVLLNIDQMNTKFN